MRTVTGIAPGRRDRKKLATRQALRSAALQLMAERGFDHVTVEDIAEAVDVSTRTFFNYFSSKEEVIVGTNPEGLERLRTLLAARPEDEAPLESLRAGLVELTADLTESREDWALRSRVVRETPALLARQLAAFFAFERLLADAVARRTGTDPEQDVYPALTAAVAVSALRVAVGLWRGDEGSRPLPQLLASAFDQLTAGLPVPGQHRDPASSLRGLASL